MNFPAPLHGAPLPACMQPGMPMHPGMPMMAPPPVLGGISQEQKQEMLAQLSEQYEMIIIDSPPVELVSDPLVLAPLATNVALVVKAMSTPTPLVRKTQQRLQRAGGNLMGVVVNGLDFKHAKRYYGEYTHSTYTYGGDGYRPKVRSDKHKAPVMSIKGAAQRIKAAITRSGEERKAA
jgi:Mrp family chromosome partitioning ATPase